MLDLFQEIVCLTTNLCIYAIIYNIFNIELVPLLYVANDDLSESDCSVSVAVHSILHGSELLHLLLVKLVTHVVEKCELADTVQYGID